MIIQPTYVGLVSLYGYRYFSIERGNYLNLTCMNESGPVVLMP